jgi:hypothetical protein
LTNEKEMIHNRDQRATSASVRKGKEVERSGSYDRLVGGSQRNSEDRLNVEGREMQRAAKRSPVLSVM